MGVGDLDLPDVPLGQDGSGVRSNRDGATAPGKRLSILVVEDSLRENGAVRLMFDLAPRWQQLGHQVELFVVQRVDGAASPPVGVPVSYSTPAPARLRRSLPAAWPRLLAACRRADVVVANSEIGSGFLLSQAAAQVAGKPFVDVVHADLDSALRAWVPAPVRVLVRLAHRRVHTAVCVAPDLVDPLVRNGLPRGRARVILNGVDVGSLSARACAGPSLVRPGQVTVVAVGRLAPEKDFELLVRAHAAARVLAPHRLLILGDGPRRDALTALTRELGVDDTVDLPGFCANPFPSVSDASLLALSSRSEGLPLTVLEALALGVPVLATDCGSGVRLALRDGALGQLVPVGSVTNFADALVRHLRSPAQLRAKARGGPAHARGFDVNTTAVRYLDVLGAAVAEVAPGSVARA